MSKLRTLDIEQLSEMFGALANPNRLTLFLRLRDCCSPARSCSADGNMGTCVGDLAQGLGLAPSTVSHHLKELRRTGLISMNRLGRRVECSINAEALKELSDLVGFLPQRQCTCDDAVDESRGAREKRGRKHDTAHP